MLPETTSVVSLILCAGFSWGQGPPDGLGGVGGACCLGLGDGDVLRPVGNNQSTRLITMLLSRLQHRRLGE